MTASQPRKVVITGATGALGQAVLARFQSAGDAIVAVHSPNQKPATQDGVEWVGLDLTQKKPVQDLFNRIDGVDAVIHCAGGFRWGHVEQLAPDDFRFLISLNFESSFHVASAAVPGMKKKGGTMLFISSRATLVPAVGMSAYAASKAAVNAMVTTLAEELKADNIRVNAVLPSVIDTAVNRKDMPHADPSKWVSPEDLAEILYDLTLPKSKSITGALIPVSGKL